MKIIRQIGIIFTVCWLSILVEKALPFSFPASVIGMILLFICLLTGVLKIEHIQEKADFLLENMAFFFIPSGVALIEQVDILRAKLVPLLLVCLITTVLTFFVSAMTIRLVTRWQNSLKKEEK